MSALINEPTHVWMEGSQYPPNELANRFNVPRDEIAAFLSFTRIYPSGSALIIEEEFDKSLFLLRSGRLGVYKNMAGQETQIGMIEAVNFVGEMSLINDERRSATIRAISDQALVYCFAKPNLSLILSNPKWAELLIFRLSKNLAHSNKQLAEARTLIELQKKEIAGLQGGLENQKDDQQHALANAAQALAGILHFENATITHAVVGSKGWAYLVALSEVSQALIRHYLPGLHVASSAADRAALKKCLDQVRKSSLAGVFEDFDDSLK